MPLPPSSSERPASNDLSWARSRTAPGPVNSFRASSQLRSDCKEPGRAPGFPAEPGSTIPGWERKGGAFSNQPINFPILHRFLMGISPTNPFPRSLRFCVPYPIEPFPRLGSAPPGRHLAPTVQASKRSTSQALLASTAHAPAEDFPCYCPSRGPVHKTCALGGGG